ncbi:tetratricopeptide repeat protein [uncultured Maricaulis sp.]|uniref:tetratricopeptide repeat protein n=1 Tax=uncultured Maricaulis sp. TaxID=174710 RepID=UPI0030DBDD03|tara:strand:- start:87758 stop:88921 length:1164 start_codon:yes stop_codon:yes gene_type:complete
MKIISALCLGLALAAPALAQFDIETPAAAAAEPQEAFPAELMLLPQDVQDAAIAGMDATEAEVPTTLNPADAAYYRAQIAYIGQDWELARRYAETAAAGGNAEAAMLAGIIARDGLTGDPDFAAATQWFRRAAVEEAPMALYQLGLLARLGDASLGLGSPRSWFERAARGGHVNAMVAYALELKNSPVPQDALSAREWADRAAQQGSPEGMYQLAQMLDAGIGGAADSAGARTWYERAASNRHAEGAFQAAMMWANGEGGDQDDATALRWMRISAESGYAPAEGQYGLMLYQGRGGDPDHEAAAYWFEQGARGGDAESQFLYAYALARGDGVTTDLETAYGWTLMGAVDALGAPVGDPDRDRLQAGLERALPLDVQQRIQAQVAALR